MQGAVAMGEYTDRNALESLYLSTLEVVVACCGIYGISLAGAGRGGGKIRCSGGINSKSLAGVAVAARQSLASRGLTLMHLSRLPHGAWRRIASHERHMGGGTRIYYNDCPVLRAQKPGSVESAMAKLLDSLNDTITRKDGPKPNPMRPKKNLSASSPTSHFVLYPLSPRSSISC